MKFQRLTTQVYILIFIFLAGCGQNITPQQPTIPADDYYTQAAQTIMVELTENAPTVAPTETIALPTETASPTITSTETQLPTETSETTQTIEPSLTPRATLRPGFEFTDNFKTNTGWVEEVSGDFGFEYVNNTYVIFNNLLNAAIYSVRQRELGDVYIEVDATKLDGPVDGYFGVVCRFVDPRNYYALVIGTDGFYGFGRMEDGKYEFLDTGTADEEVINPDNEVNKIKVECVGDRLALIANEESLLEVEDDDFESGAVGLVVGNMMTDIGTKVSFNNFYLFAP